MMLHGPLVSLSCAIICAGFAWRPVLTALTETPSINTLALLHSRTSLKCSTNLTPPIDWYFFPSAQPSTKIPIYLNEAITTTIQHKYRVDSSIKGTYELIMESVDWSHVGTYLCYDEAGIGVTASSTLTVLDPIPRWDTVHSENNGIVFPCSSYHFQFSYFGNLTPSLRWETGESLKIQNVAKFFRLNSTEKRPTNVKFLNLTMNLCEEQNYTNYYLVCAQKTMQNPEDMADEFVTHSVSVQQLQSKTIFALQCRSHSIPVITHPSVSEQHSGMFSWQPLLIAATVLSAVIVLLIVCIISFKKRNHDRVKTANITVTALNMNTSNVVTITEISPTEPSYVNISNDLPLSTPNMSSVSPSVSPRGHWNPVYVGMAAHRTTRSGSPQTRASCRTPEGQDSQMPPLNRMHRRDRTRGSDYLEIIP